MGTHPIFESDFDCLTEFEMSDWSNSDWDGLDSDNPPNDHSQSDDSSQDAPKCPVCLVSTALNVVTQCNHAYCLRCVIRMWNSENDELEEEEHSNPIICPMCRNMVTKLTWLGKASNHEVDEYNQKFSEYEPSTTRPVSAQKGFSSALIILYLLLFLQVSPFLSPIVGFLYRPSSKARGNIGD